MNRTCQENLCKVLGGEDMASRGFYIYISDNVRQRINISFRSHDSGGNYDSDSVDYYDKNKEEKKINKVKKKLE